MEGALSPQLVAWPDMSQYRCQRLVGVSGASTNKLERNFQNEACQCPGGTASFPKWLPPVSESLGTELQSPPSLQEGLQLGLTQTPFN